VSYTALAVAGVVAAVALDTVVLRTRLLARRLFWTAYAIVVFFQLVTNGILTGFRIVRYDPAAILGPRLLFAPVEDLLFGFALVLSTLAWWVWWGRRRHDDRRRPAPPAPQPRRSPSSDC
jgi:lycopene cyclase domain-containing protein